MFENCLLVKMTRKRPQAEKYDSQATYNYNSEKETDVKIYKDLFKGNKLVNALNNCYTDAYVYHVHHTLPWLDKGFRMIFGPNVVSYMTHIGECRATMETLLKEIEPQYQDMVTADLGRLKELGNPIDYPTFADFAGSWKLMVDFRPVPQTGDYRIAVPQEITDGLQQQLQDLGVKTKELLRSNLKHEFKNFYEALEKPDKERRLFESTFDGLYDLVKRTYDLNVLNDTDLTYVLDRLTTVMANFSLADLRKFPEARQEFITSTSTELEKLQ